MSFSRFIYLFPCPARSSWSNGYRTARSMLFCTTPFCTATKCFAQAKLPLAGQLVGEVVIATDHVRLLGIALSHRVADQRLSGRHRGGCRARLVLSCGFEVLRLRPNWR